MSGFPNPPPYLPGPPLYNGAGVTIQGITAEALNANFGAVTSSLVLNVKWFGAYGDGIHDDTAAIQAAAGTTTGGLYFPAGTYLVSGAVSLPTGGHYFGAGHAASIITTNSLTADVLQVNASHTSIADLGITSSVTKTGGAFLNIIGSYIDIERVNLTNWFTGAIVGSASLDPTTIRIRNSWLTSPAANGTQSGIQVLNGLDLVLDNLLITGGPGHNLLYGILIENCGDIAINHIDVIYGGSGLCLAPQSGQNVQVAYVSNSYFDTCTGTGIYLAPNNAYVQLLKLDKVWSCTNAAGLTVVGAGTGAVQQFDVVNSLFSNNTGPGVLLQSGSPHSTFAACSMAANSIGFEVATGVVNFRVMGCTIGQSGEFAGNGTGIILNGSNDGFSITDNNVVNNTSAAMTFGGSSGTPGNSYFIARNDGILTNNYGELITTAGPTAFTITHGLAFTPLYEDIHLTLGTGLGAATSFWLSGVTATTFTITFNAAPGVNVGIFWRARIMGS